MDLEGNFTGFCDWMDTEGDEERWAKNDWKILSCNEERWVNVFTLPLSQISNEMN